VLGAAAGAAASRRGESFGPPVVAVAAFAVGMVTAMIVDAAVLSYAPPPPHREARAKSWKPSFVPSAGLRAEGGFDVGIAGTL
jgi:hypothetical protein